jgi:hypothetical protein
MGQQMSEVFWGLVLTTLVGFILALGKLCYKSKCSQIEFCCIKITRNIDAEVKEDIEMGDSTKNNEETKK